MDSKWVLVANGSEARLFSLNGKELSLLSEHSHPESREKGAERTSDRPGHYQSDSGGVAHGSFQEPTDPKDFEIEQFARELAQVLDEGRTANRYAHLVIAASPHFHGLLNKHLNDHVSQMVSAHVEKDYTQVDERNLMEQLGPHL